MPIRDEVANVIRLVKPRGGKRQADRAAGEVIDLTPIHRRDIEAVVRTIEMKAAAVATVVDMNVEAARQRNEQLMQGLVGVATALGATWDVVQVIDSFDVERDMDPALDERKVSALVRDLRQP
jgi:hypothetical protein